MLSRPWASLRPNSLTARPCGPTASTGRGWRPPLKLSEQLSREAQQYSGRCQHEDPQAQLRGQCVASAERTWPGHPAISQDRGWRTGGTMTLRTTTSSGLLPLWDGALHGHVWKNTKKMGWERHLQVMGPPLWRLDTSQQGMSSTRASLRKTSCLQRSNLPNAMGRRQS